MATETKSFVDIFFNYPDADHFIHSYLVDFFDEMQDEWNIKDLEIKLMPSGGYRAGVVFEKKV